LLLFVHLRLATVAKCEGDGVGWLVVLMAAIILQIGLHVFHIFFIGLPIVGVEEYQLLTSKKDNKYIVLLWAFLN
jgi:hypothetical protein